MYVKQPISSCTTGAYGPSVSSLGPHAGSLLVRVASDVQVSAPRALRGGCGKGPTVGPAH
jgi:hypothetical protein